MFYKQKIDKLESRIKNLEGAMQRMQSYLLSMQYTDVLVAFEPDKNLTAAVKGKKLN